MKKEEKELLLCDLCARLPYGAFVQFEVDGQKTIKSLNVDFFSSAWYHTEYIKPYLRPMSSMTKEERKEYNKVMFQSERYEDAYVTDVDWLNSHHFDYRGLIEKGLALVAPDGMYNETK